MHYNVQYTVTLTTITQQIQRTPLGAFQTQVACPGCRGTGQKVEAYCSPCNGQGLIEQTKPVKVRIPAGVVSQLLQLIKHVSVQL
jgi:DnaJ-class molecular chaperone